MAKIRTYLVPSAIGSYFGVGFNTPEEQYLMDIGEKTPEFDDESKKRMKLGNVLENPVLDYFEWLFDIKITDRNSKLIDFYDSKIFGKIDGKTVLNGVPTLVENKISTTDFTNSVNYQLQVQSYMLMEGYEQCLLLGLREGRPEYKLIKKDLEIAKDIMRMADFITDVLTGLESFENYPIDLITKYGGQKEKVILSKEQVGEGFIETAIEIAKKKNEIKLLEAEVKEKEALLKSTFDEGEFKDKEIGLSVSISKQSRAGGYDTARLSIEHPEIDLEKYRKPDSRFQTMRITYKPPIS